MVDCRKVRNGTMVECQECHKVFYGNKQRKFCDDCTKEKAKSRQKERYKIKAVEKEKKEAVRGKIPPPQVVPLPLGKGGSGYVSLEERFGISSETGKIFSFVRQVEEYNRLNGTRLSYGQYENMLFLERKKRKNDKNPSTASGPPVSPAGSVGASDGAEVSTGYPRPLGKGGCNARQEKNCQTQCKR